jgi:outer membrane receptor for ferrienterochelin and colicin
MWRVGFKSVLPCLLCTTCLISPVFAQTTGLAPEAAIANPSTMPSSINGKRTFTPAFFAADRPQTALDMVGRVPGFGIEDGDSARGFGGTAGNVLIDGARPTTKDQSLQTLLSRIPAASVEAIELLEGAAAGALAPGKTVVVNVVRKADAKSGGTYSVQGIVHSNGYVRPEIELSYTRKIGGFDVSFGVQHEVGDRRELIGIEGFLTPQGAWIERGPNHDRRNSVGTDINLGIGGKLGDTKVNMSALYGFGGNTRRWNALAIRTGQTLPYRIDEGLETGDGTKWELGGDIERDIWGWTGKIALLAKSLQEENGSEAGFNLVNTPKFFTRFESDSQSDERIARVTFKRKFGSHQIETGGEYAFNALDFDGRFLTGRPGAFVLAPGDISSTVVEEARKEAFISDSWTINPKWTLEGTLTGEWSTISQSGDAAKERSFFYAKPRVKLAWKPADGLTFRGEVERGVGQLDFSAFADSAAVGDGNQNSGNPELRPEQVVTALFGFERRWGKRGVVNASIVAEEFEDRLTLVPTRNGGIALGNVPEASRWGWNYNFILPLDGLIKGLEIEANQRWRDSEILDPLTGRSRPFSGWNGNSFEANVRQDLPSKKLRMGAWFWRGDQSSEYRSAQTFEWTSNEFWGLWIESKAFKDMTIEVGVETPFGNKFKRYRTDYDPDRRTGQISQIQYRDRKIDGEFYIQIKGKL